MSIMKITLGIAATVAILTVAATAATAATPVWQGCAEIKGGRYENSKCSAKGTAQKFDWLEENSKPQAVSSEGTLKLADTKTGLTVQCSTTGTETIGGEENASVDEVKELKTKGCSTIKGTCAEPSIEAVNLPWKTELSEVGAEIRDKIKTAAKSPPGLKILCGKTSTDICEGETSTKTKNNEKEGAVEAELEGKSENLTCTSGGKGEAIGLNKIKVPEKGIGAVRAVKASNFKVTASPREIKKNQKSIITIKALKAAETKVLLHDEAPAKTFKFEEPEIELCEGKYAALETCKFSIQYTGEVRSLFIVLLLDENEGASATTVLGE